ncbi:hypothetical protein EDB81DRAFT_281124 [Dactylonectria macrodidyma]|uniref:Ilp is an apoptosis inhibitor n=1 Tax=Dactylonectria macrodidyma TaxID=307937 RepID=A0A9P9FN81_9HYPO|nr:hypothetical protein EDB81DRAFT_281124 [Dactylonectria macrodidyma]
MSTHFQPPFQAFEYDIFDWYGKFQSCQRYFLDHAQYTSPVQTVAASVNILLPCQKPSTSVLTNRSAPPAVASSRATGAVPAPHGSEVSLIPYIRRLVVTGFDAPAVLHGFFGDDWLQGIGSLHEAERRNFLFAAKSDSWLGVKSHYDMADGQTVPFLKPLQNVTEAEIEGAESNWSEWLAMQDWMLGPRAPPNVGERGARVKREQS